MIPGGFRYCVTFPKKYTGVFLVKNEQGEPYYYRDFEGMKKFYFNIPDKGNYSVSCNSNFDLTKTSIKKVLIFSQKTSDIIINSCKIFFNENLNHTPARIFKEIKRIEVSPKFMSMPILVQRAILYHEIGHFFYGKNEYDCDFYSMNEILRKGENISQLFYAIKLTCKKSQLSEERKNKITKISHQINKK